METNSTKELTEELTNRPGITEIRVDPFEEIKIITGRQETRFTGPAIILINQD